jgi:hypothetical protein
MSVAHDRRRVVDLVEELLDRLLERNSFAKPRPTETATITTMIPESVTCPVNPDTTAAITRSGKSGLRSWFHSTRHALVPRVLSEFGPTSASRRAASTSSSPSLEVPRRVSTASGSRAAAVRRSRISATTAVPIDCTTLPHSTARRWGRGAAACIMEG